PLRLEHAFGRRRKLCELAGWTDRAPREVAAAIRAAAAELRFHAIAAEHALERADHGVGRGRRQLLVAASAVRSQRAHASLLSSTVPCWPCGAGRGRCRRPPFQRTANRSISSACFGAFTGGSTLGLSSVSSVMQSSDSWMP